MQSFKESEVIGDGEDCKSLATIASSSRKTEYKLSEFSNTINTKRSQSLGKIFKTFHENMFYSERNKNSHKRERNRQQEGNDESI